MNLRFDPANDVLYVSVGEPREGIAESMGNGLFLRFDPETDEIIGFTVVDFTKSAAARPRGVDVDQVDVAMTATAGASC